MTGQMIGDQLRGAAAVAKSQTYAATGQWRDMAGGIANVSRYIRELEPRFARSDVYAQLLRLRTLAERAGVATVDRLTASSEAEKLASFQIGDSDPRYQWRLAGAFCARWRRSAR